MKATMSHYFLSQRNARDYVSFINVEKNINHAYLMLSMLRIIIHELDNHLEERCNAKT